MISGNRSIVLNCQFSDLVEFHNWLTEKAASHQLTYLLAHADDGVIWAN